MPVLRKIPVVGHHFVEVANFKTTDIAMKNPDAIEKLKCKLEINTLDSNCHFGF